MQMFENWKQTKLSAQIERLFCFHWGASDVYDIEQTLLISHLIQLLPDSLFAKVCVSCFVFVGSEFVQFNFIPLPCFFNLRMHVFRDK